MNQALFLMDIQKFSRLDLCLTGHARVMAKDLKKGDKVEWQSHGGTAVGKVESKITTETDAAGRHVKASKAEPQFKVRSDKGGDAVHKPEALKKR